MTPPPPNPTHPAERAEARALWPHATLKGSTLAIARAVAAEHQAALHLTPEHAAGLAAGTHVVMPLEVLLTIAQAFLPTNPNKMRSAAPGVREAAHFVKRAVATQPREGETP